MITDPAQENSERTLSQYPELLQQLLRKISIETDESADVFLSPDYERDTHDPFLLRDMDKAVKRIEKALVAKETIAIFSDYDADGIPGAVVLSDFFRKINYENIEVYIPHRNREGFGLNIGAIDSLKEKGVSLLITIDCGSANTKEVVYAEDLGINVIVTDHHHVPDPAPEPFALVNPNQPGCEYPNKALCGAAVAFKLVQALIQHGKYDIPSGWEKWLLDMVGIATVADMVSLREPENRALASFGLFVLRKSRRPGIQRLCRATGADQRKLTEDDIGFTIGPRINAASRMDKPELAYRLLATEDPVEAAEMVKVLDKLNNERKTRVAVMTKEVKKKLRERSKIPAVIVAGNPEWPPSLVGLVANSVMDTYGTPVFVWGRDEKGVLKGSCRAPKGNSLIALMDAAPSGTFIEYGGHECSGGFSITLDQIDRVEALLAAEQEKIGADAMAGPLVDAEITLDRVNWSTHQLVSRMAPFGVDNPKPLFLVTDAKLVDPILFGKAKNHIAGQLHSPNTMMKVRAFRFFATLEQVPEIIEGGITGHLEKGFRKSSIEMRLV